jgi:YegS/Rv2252/BmrU family lipid kinase
MAISLKPGSNVLIIINPVSGTSDPKLLKKICEEEFRAAGWHTRFHLTKPKENLAEVIKVEIEKGVDLVVAVGGDGTIAAVAASLQRTHIPLGIIPTGTWNAIARHLNIPASPQRAIALMTGKHTKRKLDMMAVADTVHAMNIGVGFSAKMSNYTDRDQKRKWGYLAYFKQIFQQLFGLQMHRYIIEADGVRYKGRATEIMVANYGVVGLRFLEDRLNIHPDDGKVDVLIFIARTVLDLPNMFWQVFIKRNKRTPKYRKLSAVKKLVITTYPPAQVQADGEFLGETPIEVTVMHRSVHVIAP